MADRSQFQHVISHRFTLKAAQEPPDLQLFTQTSVALEEKAFVIVLDVEIDGRAVLAHVDGYAWSKMLAGSYKYWQPTSDGLLILPKLPRADRTIQITITVLEWLDSSAEKLERMSLLRAHETDRALILETFEPTPND